eukprot:TRINITY_DN2945_c0_g1_i1.p1 TRINITY_DN2945_c0_g1~~TRINITY_DN2945_c0_g1_i1.p1  ORF type:complete len:310 (+),score=67.09 TRINITY_DN2945_c0_g1_i1:37-966(+)
MADAHSSIAEDRNGYRIGKESDSVSRPAAKTTIKSKLDKTTDLEIERIKIEGERVQQEAERGRKHLELLKQFKCLKDEIAALDDLLEAERKKKSEQKLSVNSKIKKANEKIKQHDATMTKLMQHNIKLGTKYERSAMSIIMEEESMLWDNLDKFNEERSDDENSYILVKEDIRRKEDEAVIKKLLLKISTAEKDILQKEETERSLSREVEYWKGQALMQENQRGKLAEENEELRQIADSLPDTGGGINWDDTHSNDETYHRRESVKPPTGVFSQSMKRPLLEQEGKFDEFDEEFPPLRDSRHSKFCIVC